MGSFWEVDSGPSSSVPELMTSDGRIGCEGRWDASLRRGSLWLTLDGVKLSCWR
jgi:hypothetical protein